MKFAFLGYGLEKDWAGMSSSEQGAMLEACFGYDCKLLQDGHLLEEGGAAMQPTCTAKTLRWQNGAVVVTDGPYAETKEQLGGIGILVARDMTQAVELMSMHPGLHYGAAFEIRPIDEDALKRQAASLAAWRGSAPADPNAKKFATLGYIQESGRGAIAAGDFETMMQRCSAFDEARVKNGQWLAGVKLQSTTTAKTLRASAGKVVVTDGPFAETKEALGGLVVLAVEDQNEAIALLSTHPALAFGVIMEIRPTNDEVDKVWDAVKTQAASA